MLDGRWRTSFEAGLRPVGLSLRSHGISANHLTTLGVVMSVFAAVSIGFGYLGLGLLFLVMTAVPDVLDGAVAKASGTASPRGAFFDSVMDREGVAMRLVGGAWYVADGRGGYWGLRPVGVWATSMLISYERAKAESLGFDARGGLMERAERIVVLGLGLLFEPLLIPLLFVMLALTLVTAVQRFVKVWKQASGDVVKPSRRTPRTQRRTMRASSTQRRRDRPRQGQSRQNQPRQNQPRQNQWRQAMRDARDRRG